MVPDFPGGIMVYVDVVRDRDSLSEVDHPDRSSFIVVDEEQGATDQLMGSEKW